MTMSTSYGDEAREGKPKEVVAESPTKVYNLLWVSPTFPVPGEQFWQPVPSPTVENMQGIADRNQNVDVQLYVDSRRLTDAQMGWLEKMMMGSECVRGSCRRMRTTSKPEMPSSSKWRSRRIGGEAQIFSRARSPLWMMSVS